MDTPSAMYTIAFTYPIVVAFIGRLIGLIIAGLIVGALGRLFHPGRDPMGLLMTMAIGIAAVIIAGLLIDHGVLGFIVAIVIGVGLVALVGRVAGRR